MDEYCFDKSRVAPDAAAIEATCPRFLHAE